MPWSDWITPDPYVFDSTRVSAITFTGRWYEPDYVVGDADAGALAASFVDVVQAGTSPADTSGAIFATGPGFVYGVDKPKDHSGGVSVGGLAGLTQYAVTLDGTGHDTDFDWFPALLATLTEGVDYTIRPDRTSSDPDKYVEYEADAVVLAGWQDWPMSTTQTDQMANTTDAVVGFPASWTVRFAKLDAVDPVGALWPAYTDGSTLDTAIVTVNTSTQNSGTPYNNSGAWSHSVSMSAVGPVGEWTFVIQPSFLATDPPTWDFSPPAAIGDDVRWEYFSHLGLRGSTYVGSQLPKVLWQAPRWRYWIPELDKLRTVGDHFRSVGGADVKSLIPGSGWVKVRRGT